MQSSQIKYASHKTCSKGKGLAWIQMKLKQWYTEQSAQKPQKV